MLFDRLKQRINQYSDETIISSIDLHSSGNFPLELYFHGKFEEILSWMKAIKMQNRPVAERIDLCLLEAQCLNKIGQYEHNLNFQSLFKTQFGIEPVPHGIEIEILVIQVEALRFSGKIEEGLKILEKCFEIAEKGSLNPEEEQYYQGCLLNLQGTLFYHQGNFQQGYHSLNRSYELRKKMGFAPNIATTLNNLGNIYALKSQYLKAMECYQESLDIRQNWGDGRDIAQSLNNIGTIYHEKGELDKSLGYYFKSLKLSEEIGNKADLAIDYQNIGEIYELKGALIQSLTYYNKSLNASKQGEFKFGIAMALQNIGHIHYMKGNPLEANGYYQKSLSLHEQIGNSIETGLVLFRLVSISLEMNIIEDARRFFQNLKDLKKNEENSFIVLFYDVAHALLLKYSGRFRDLGLAITIFEDVIKKNIISHEITVSCLLNLCEILLVELQTTVNEVIIDEIDKYVQKLLGIAEKQKSSLLYAKTYWLQAQISLVKMDFDLTRQKLTKAQKIAQQYGLSDLAQKISNDHDRLLEQLDLWNNYKSEQASIKERIKLASLDKKLAELVRDQKDEQEEMDPETPIFFTIMRKTGTPVFSMSFSNTWDLNDSLFGGFLTAFNSFSHEVFEERLDRAKFGDYLILMQTLEPFVVCYVIKYNSYAAQNKLQKLLKTMRGNPTIWEKLHKAETTCQYLLKADVPALVALISKSLK